MYIDAPVSGAICDTAPPPIQPSNAVSTPHNGARSFFAIVKTIHIIPTFSKFFTFRFHMLKPSRET